MPPKRIDDMDIDSDDSDISIELGNISKGKSKKGKAGDKRKQDKGKGKAKEVSTLVSEQFFDFSSSLVQQAYTWEASFTRSWETVQEDEAGSLQTSVEDLMARGRRRR